MGIHGDKSQQERDWVLNGEVVFLFTLNYCLSGGLTRMSDLSEFKYGKAPILIATDVASRGLGQYPP